MLPDIDIWRAVALMIKRYGDEADVEAAVLMRPAKDVLQERPLGKAINNVKNNGAGAAGMTAGSSRQRRLRVQRLY